MRILYILALLLLTGCYNAKKAQKQVNKALLEYPDKVATIARDAFPCITTASDTVTVTDTLFDFIDCPEAPGPEYVRDTVVISGIKTVTVKVPGKTQVKTVTVTQRIEDSAKIKLLTSAIADRDQQIDENKSEIKKQDKKISRKNKELWVHRSLWFLLILYGCYRIWRNVTTLKIR
jgi:hypothetical protein